MSIDEIVKDILTTKSTFVLALWNADEKILGKRCPHPDKPFDHSCADLALCNFLAFTTNDDADQMDRIFRRSKLYREKWENREDYRRRTIDQAIKTWGKK